VSAFLLKTIASVSMLIDHIGAVFYAPLFFRWIGRVAFPIYAFLIAQGCKYTKNINKYLFRLGIFALISEIPFDLAFNSMSQNLCSNINFLRYTNIFYTLFLGVACIAVYEKLKVKKRQWLAIIPILFLPAILLTNYLPDNSSVTPTTLAAIVMAAYTAGALCFAYFLKESDVEVTLKKKIIPLLVAIPVIITAGAFKTDYGMFGTGLIFVLYLANPQKIIRQATVLAGAVIYLYAIKGSSIIRIYWDYIDGVFTEVGSSINWHSVWHTLFALTSAVLILFYNGKRGRNIKWSFYAFYPVHIAVLVAIRFLLEKA